MATTKRRFILINTRKQNNWLQKDVVEKLYSEFNITISESYYGMIEQGVRTPSLDVALAISELFNMEPSKIFLNNKTTFCCVG
ncbi:helix-turn-helix transcriptional regulator [Lysinibacillus sp. NPDC096418]|uniref:helix-turn-helix transcriptional regulator n=1 Tax=Lysinibacillus sp. NPDC096418 TaxID=3364138 RepID=UPI00381BA74A